MKRTIAVVLTLIIHISLMDSCFAGEDWYSFGNFAVCKYGDFNSCKLLDSKSKENFGLSQIEQENFDQLVRYSQMKSFVVEDAKAWFGQPQLTPEIPGDSNGAIWFYVNKDARRECSVTIVMAKGKLVSIAYTVPSKFMSIWRAPVVPHSSK
ncbi:hypothetical protein ACO0LD_22930 [Undibacterium sp. Ji83W]|uniref:hypothetical protein n=1 Tax=Undibacterium sp. Ji83W TaxID=3413043 RepID=UPI003BEF64DB